MSHEDIDWVVIDSLPGDDEMIVLTPEPALPATSQIVATLESDTQVLKISTRIGRAGEVMDARVFIDKPEDGAVAEHRFGIAAAVLAQSIERNNG